MDGGGRNVFGQVLSAFHQSTWLDEYSTLSPILFSHLASIEHKSIASLITPADVTTMKITFESTREFGMADFASLIPMGSLEIGG